MSKMRLLRSRWRYAKTPLKEGDIFEVKELHVPLLTQAKIAEPYYEEGQSEAEKETAQTAQASARQPPRHRAASAAPKTTDKNPHEMTVTELKAFARANGIAFPSAATKAELLKKVIGRYGRRDMRASEE